jgi:hypothetical protein
MWPVRTQRFQRPRRIETTSVTTIEIGLRSAEILMR